MKRALGLPWILLGLLAAGCQTASIPDEPAPEEPGRPPEIADRLRPTLKWASFQPEGDPMREIGPTDVSYDLRIYRLEEGILLLREPFYSRNGLRESVHRIETPLDPNGHYVWTSRATFLVNGSLRHTPWSTRGGSSRLALLGPLPPLYHPLGVP